MIVALPTGRPAMAADKATALIEAVSRAAVDAGTWEAEGRVAIQGSGDDPSLRTEASFRSVLEWLPTGRARLEITGVPAPLVLVCDGSAWWGYRPAANRFWRVDDARIEPCAEPFNEWPFLAEDLHQAVITGQEQLHIGDKAIDCTVVSGNYTGTSRSGKRTLWIDEVTKTIWQYRTEHGAVNRTGTVEPAVRIYTLLRQSRAGVSQPGEFAFQVPDDAVKLRVRPWWRLGDGAPVPARIHFEPPGVYRVGNGASAPVLIFKTEPEYTEQARHSHIQGTVVLSVEIGPDGAARNVKVVRSLDPGLDQRAIETVSQWRFKPGMRDGVPVTVTATIEMNFRMLDNPNGK
jgi:TonB family protein